MLEEKPSEDVQTTCGHTGRDKRKLWDQRIVDQDLGTMYLINNKALVVRASSQILFFKQVINPFSKNRYWEQYDSLDIRGFIFFIRGNERL